MSLPAVNVVILSLPSVVVELVRPEPTVMVRVFGYLTITTPEPPAPEFKAGVPVCPPAPPPPAPRLAVPLVA